MEAKKKAAFVKDMSEFFTGSAGLYRLVPPFQRNHLDPNGLPCVQVIQYVVAADAMIQGVLIGTTLYETDETGYVTSWNRLHHSPMTDTRHEAMAAIGYVIEEDRDAGQR